MKKDQAFKFWDALDDSTSLKVPISSFENKKGYGDRRTLERYAQAHEGFKDDLTSDVIARKTGWGVKYIEKIRSWWEQKYRKETQDGPNQGKRISPEEQLRDKGGLRRLIQECRRELAAFSPVQLLQDWLGKAHEDAITRWYYNKDVEMLYQEAGERDGEPLQTKSLAQAQSESPFELLKQRFPDSEVWDAAGTWSERKTPYVQAFHQMLKEIEKVVVHGLATVITGFAEKGVEGVDWIDCAAFSGLENRCRFERLLTVLVACDALALGIAKRPSKPYQTDLVSALRELRRRTDVQRSAVTGIPAKGGWVSGIVEVWKQAPERALEITREFLDQLAELQSAEESIVKALKQLESEI